MNIRVWPWFLLGLALVPALLINVPKPQVIETSPAQATLVEAIWSMPTNLDPALANSPSDWQVDDNVFEPLLSETSSGQIVPDVASLATFQGNVVTIKLGNHRLTNGGIMTADTVAEALARPLLPQVNSPTAKHLLSSVVGYQHMVSGHLNYLSGVKVVNPSSVTITLKHSATVAFLRALANPALSMVPLSDQLRGGASWQFTNLYGTAGYRLTNWTPGDHLTFQRVFGTGPSQVQLQLYSSFQLAVLGFINKAVSVVPVAAAQLRKVPVKERNRIAFLPTPGTISLFLSPNLRKISAYPTTAPINTWVSRTFLGRESSQGFNWPTGLPTDRAMTVWVNGQDSTAVVLAQTLSKLTHGKVSVQVSTAAQIQALASKGQIAAYIGTQDRIRRGTGIPLVRRGNFWLLDHDIMTAQGFANGALNWQSITWRK